MKNRIIESLLALGGKKNKDNSIDLLSSGLLIICKDTGFKYTVSELFFENDKPVIRCYRYSGPNSEDFISIDIHEKDFSNYEAA